ncbi:uncharacterized protein LOC111698689 [Eurytemora carolleeae]|uniref:uncharacterized protein LOC111698689 n=1 Tax=Eurytemora carolleeae TaxID=1294199 RepID=UPI000C78647F|nr:uncharacterized protein LOC111698689 [Eurytemora carolleeae]|eukprot:XP_023324897.1 uncharacterized protein LOC111698689 [Eurytemora affinis]
MDGLEGSSRRLQEAIDSPRRTKLKVSGGTQTAGGDDGKGPPGSTRAPGSIRAPDLEARKIIDADEHGFEDFYQNSQQKSAGSGNMQLSSSTRERLIASQRRPANTVSGFTKPRTRNAQYLNS